MRRPFDEAGLSGASEENTKKDFRSSFIGQGGRGNFYLGVGGELSFGEMKRARHVLFEDRGGARQRLFWGWDEAERRQIKLSWEGVQG